MALLAAASLSSCGSGPAPIAAKPPPPVGGTPTGTYTITCTAYQGSPLAAGPAEMPLLGKLGPNPA